MPEEPKCYVLNINSKRIHDTTAADGRCKLNSMRPEYKKYFDTLEEALAFPSAENRLAKPCQFCIGNKSNYHH